MLAAVAVSLPLQTVGFGITLDALCITRAVTVPNAMAKLPAVEALDL